MGRPQKQRYLSLIQPIGDVVWLGKTKLAIFLNHYCDSARRKAIIKKPFLWSLWNMTLFCRAYYHECIFVDMKARISSEKETKVMILTFWGRSARTSFTHCSVSEILSLPSFNGITPAESMTLDVGGCVLYTAALMSRSNEAGPIKQAWCLGVVSHSWLSVNPSVKARSNWWVSEIYDALCRLKCAMLQPHENGQIYRPSSFNDKTSLKLSGHQLNLQQVWYYD